jgi:hypothetical protein
MTKARKEGSSLGPVIAELLPSDLEIQFRRIGIDLGKVGECCAQGRHGFRPVQELPRPDRAPGRADRLQEIARVADGSRPSRTRIPRVDRSVQGFSAATRELQRKQQIAKIAGDWDEVARATDRAKSSLDVYLNTLNPPSGQTAADQFLLNTNAALDSIAQLLKDQPGIDLTSIAISGGGQAGAQVPNRHRGDPLAGIGVPQLSAPRHLEGQGQGSGSDRRRVDEIIISGVLKGIPKRRSVRSLTSSWRTALPEISPRRRRRSAPTWVRRSATASPRGNCSIRLKLQLAIPPELLGKVKLPTIIDQVLVNPNVRRTSRRRSVVG